MHMAMFQHKPSPIESLHDERIQEVMSTDYDLETDALYQDEIFQTARSIAQEDEHKTRLIYRELRRTIDGLRVIDATNVDLDQARIMIDSFVHLGQLRIEAIMHDGSPPLSPEE